MFKLSLMFSFVFFNFSGLLAMNTSSIWSDITIYNLPFSSYLNKIQESALLLFRFHYLTKHLAKILSHNSTASTFPYMEFPSKIQYSSINSFVMIPKSTVPSVHLMYISTSIFRCSNVPSVLHSYAIHPSSSW